MNHSNNSKATISSSIRIDGLASHCGLRDALVCQFVERLIRFLHKLTFNIASSDGEDVYAQFLPPSERRKANLYKEKSERQAQRHAEHLPWSSQSQYLISSILRAPATNALLWLIAPPYESPALLDEVPPVARLVTRYDKGDREIQNNCNSRKRKGMHDTQSLRVFPTRAADPTMSPTDLCLVLPHALPALYRMFPNALLATTSLATRLGPRRRFALCQTMHEFLLHA